MKIKEIERIQKKFKTWSDSLRIMTDYASKISDVYKNIKPFLKQVESYQKSFIPLLNIQKNLNKILKIAKERNTKKFKEFYKEWGWLLKTKPVSFGNYCYALYKKYGEVKFKDKVNRWFYHKKNLNSLLRQLRKKIPKERMKVIKEGFNYHGKRNYTCSIILLLPHTEGLLWDLGVKKGLVKTSYNTIEKKKTSGNWKLHILSKALFPNDKFHNILVDEVFCSGFRNKVLHGRYVYRTREKEIKRWRSTLLLLTLWRLIDEF